MCQENVKLQSISLYVMQCMHSEGKKKKKRSLKIEAYNPIGLQVVEMSILHRVAGSGLETTGWSRCTSPLCYSGIWLGSLLDTSQGRYFIYLDPSVLDGENISHLVWECLGIPMEELE